MGPLRIGAAIVALCWAVPDLPVRLLRQAPAAQAEASALAAKTFGSTVTSLCAQEPEKCAALAAAAVAMPSLAAARETAPARKAAPARPAAARATERGITLPH